MDYEYWDLSTGEPLTDHELHERYDDMLDECYETVSIGEITFSPSTVLRECDPIAYRVYFSDWLDAELGETITDEAPADDDDETEDEN